MKLSSVLTEYFCESNNIDVNANYRIEKIDASELIIPERIDLIAKLKYIEYREKGYDLSYIKEVYAAHIEAFSLGTYTEEGNDNKNSIIKYFDTFDRLIDDIKKNGMDENISVIPVGRNNIIMNGAHRTAIAAYYNLKVPIIRFNNLRTEYGTEFFKKRLLDDKYLDYLVAQYCKYKQNNIYFACVWPKAKGELQKIEMRNLINESCKVIYEKRIKFNYEGLNNLVTQIYSSQDWIGNIENNFIGAQIKTDACYRDEILTAYVLECDSHEEILKLKEKIRDVFQIKKHSIHISDNHTEVLQLASLLLNKNSIDFLNSGKPNYYMDFNRKLDKFKKKLLNNNFQLDHFIMDSNSVLGVYGLREGGDLDFMTISTGYEIIEDNYSQNNNNCIKLYGTTIDNLVLNPDNYFVYKEFKFLTLKVLRRLKKNRNEQEDKINIKLIDRVLKKKEVFLLISHKTENWFKRKKRYFKYFFKKDFCRMIKKIGIYEMAKKVYRFMKRVEM